MKLDQLPSEILRQIFSYDDLRQPYRRGLLDLKLINRALGSIAYQVDCEKMVIETRTSKKLQHLSETMSCMLKRRGCLNSVRKLTLRGMRHPGFCKDDHASESYGYKTLDWCRTVRRPHPTDDASDEPNIPCLSSAIPSNDAAWHALANLISQLPALHDVYVDCKHQLSDIVLDAIELPRRLMCRLTIASLVLDKFVWDDVDTPITHRNERLTHSPCLHSVSIPHDLSWQILFDRDGSHIDNFIVPHMIVAEAPNLKHVTTYNLPGKLVAWRRVNYWYPTHERKGAFSWIDTKKHKVLESLTLDGDCLGGSVLVQEIRLWSDLLDWEQLQELNINVLLTAEAAGALMAVRLSSLRRLNWSINPVTQLAARDRVVDGFADTVSNFLSALSPLQELQLEGWVTIEMFSSIVRYHGSSVRRLSLQPSQPRTCGGWFIPLFVSRPMIMELVETCSQLRELDIHIVRDQGSDTELALYDGLSGLLQLEKLRLRLQLALWRANADCHVILEHQSRSQHDAVDELDNLSADTLVSSGRTLRRSDFHRMIVNSVIDVESAKNIFNRISPPRPDMGQSLRTLHLTVDYTASFVFTTQDLFEISGPGDVPTSVRRYDLLRFLSPAQTLTKVLSGAIDLQTDAHKKVAETRAMLSALLEDTITLNMVQEVFQFDASKEDPYFALQRTPVPLAEDLTSVSMNLADLSRTDEP